MLVPCVVCFDCMADTDALMLVTEDCRPAMFEVWELCVVCRLATDVFQPGYARVVRLEIVLNRGS